VPAHPVRFVTATALFDGHDAGRRGRDGARGRVAVRDDPEFGARPEDMPVFGTSAATFNDTGVTALYQHLAALLKDQGLPLAQGVLPAAAGRVSTDATAVIPPAWTGYLAEIAATVRGYHEKTTEPGPTGMKGLDIIPL
jgi:isobutyryl-CoA mutase